MRSFFANNRGIAYLLFSASFSGTSLAQVENPAIRDTAYAIPSGAYFVANFGSDSNSGSATAPLRTLTRAVESAPTGSTIVMRQGTYRESVPFLSKRLTIQPYPHEQVWLKGSVVIEDWTDNGSIWTKDNWTYEFDKNSHDAAAIDPAHPFAGYPDMVFVDRQPLSQVGSLADIGPGTFFVDDGGDKLHIGTDPYGKYVEISAYSQALRIRADGTIIRGLGFMHFAGTRLEGMVQFDSSNNVTIENNTFAWAASRGLAMYRGDGAIVKGNTFLNNGKIGYASWRYDNVLVEGNRFYGNNQERFLSHGEIAEPAGAKLTVGRNWVIRGNVFETNLAAGLWLDISNYNATIVSNRIMNNHSHGIHYEISGRAIIASNLVVGNNSGIKVSNSSDVKVFNNTLIGNVENISIQDDSRENSDPEELSLGVTYISANIDVKNNILSNGDLSQNPLFWVRDYNSTPLKSADQMISGCDTNAYYRTNSGIPLKLISWWSGSRELTFDHLGDFHAATGYEADGIFIDNVSENPFFSGEDIGDYRLMSGSVAEGAGTPLPLDVADAIGVAAGEPVDLGALVLDWPNVPPPAVSRSIPPTKSRITNGNSND